MQQSGGFLESRPLPLHPGQGVPQHDTVVVRCDGIGKALLLFEQVDRTLLSMRSYGAELQPSTDPHAPGHARCRACGRVTAFDRRLLPHVAG